MGEMALQIGRALRHRNYRLFFFGQAISLTGTWMTRIATSWVVFRVASESSASYALGMIGFSSQIPSAVVAPFAGVWVDRWNRHRVIVWTQVFSMLQSFLLAAVVAIRQPTAWLITEIVLLSLLQGMINAFDMPTRQTFLHEIVTDPKDLPNAIALNSSLFNGARLVGPSVAGILIGWVGALWCFLIDGFSYVAVIIALLMMKRSAVVAQIRKSQPLADLKEGFAYAWGSKGILLLLIQIAIMSFVGMGFIVLMPIFAHRIQSDSASTLGFLMGSVGVGAMVGALYLASRPSVVGLVRVIIKCTALFGVSLIVFALSRSFLLSTICLFFVGMGMIVQMAACNTILQTIAEPDKRGRIMSLYTLAFMGGSPLGSLFVGIAAAHFGAPATIAATGVISLVAAYTFHKQLPIMRKAIRPVYIKMGILPESAA